MTEHTLRQIMHRQLRGLAILPRHVRELGQVSHQTTVAGHQSVILLIPAKFNAVDQIQVPLTADKTGLLSKVGIALHFPKETLTKRMNPLLRNVTSPEQGSYRT